MQKIVDSGGVVVWNDTLPRKLSTFKYANRISNTKGFKAYVFRHVYTDGIPKTEISMVSKEELRCLTLIS